MARFVALVDGLSEDLKRELVLIGGLTVSWRLGFEHRVTDDVDGLYFNRSPVPIEQVLTASRTPARRVPQPSRATVSNPLRR